MSYDLILDLTTCLERLVRRRGRQRAGARGADASDAAVLGRDCSEHVLCEPYARAPAGAN